MNFAKRFRVACRKAIAFSRKIAKMGPSYANCNERQSACTKQSKNPRNGCPSCEYTIQRKQYLDALEQELKDIPGASRSSQLKWPSKLLNEMVSETAYLAMTTKGTPGHWVQATAIWVSIYRDEKAKLDAVDRANNLTTVPTDDDDEDFEDFE